MDETQKYIKELYPEVCHSNDHARGFIHLKDCIRPGIVSLDISSWTDSLPAIMQLQYMEARYGSEIAEAWYNLVVDCAWSTPEKGKTLKYGTGQGMGTNGSFDIATITNLLINDMLMVKHYQSRLLISNFGEVGDDQ